MEDSRGGKRENNRQKMLKLLYAKLRNCLYLFLLFLNHPLAPSFLMLMFLVAWYPEFIGKKFNRKFN